MYLTLHRLRGDSLYIYIIHMLSRLWSEVISRRCRLICFVVVGTIRAVGVAESFTPVEGRVLCFVLAATAATVAVERRQTRLVPYDRYLVQLQHRVRLLGVWRGLGPEGRKYLIVKGGLDDIIILRELERC